MMPDDQPVENVVVRKDTLAILMAHMGEQEKARVRAEIERENREHEARMAAEERHAKLLRTVMLIVVLLVIGLLAVVGVYITFGFPDGTTIEATGEIRMGEDTDDGA